MAKPSGDYTPLGGIVLTLEKLRVHTYGEPKPNAFTG